MGLAETRAFVPLETAGLREDSSWSFWLPLLGVKDCLDWPPTAVRPSSGPPRRLCSHLRQRGGCWCKISKQDNGFELVDLSGTSAGGPEGHLSCSGEAPVVQVFGSESWTHFPESSGSLDHVLGHVLVPWLAPGATRVVFRGAVTVEPGGQTSASVNCSERLVESCWSSPTLQAGVSAPPGNSWRSWISFRLGELKLSRELSRSQQGNAVPLL